MGLSSSGRGLTSDEARQLRAAGHGNTPPPPITKPTGQIIRENVCPFSIYLMSSLPLRWRWWEPGPTFCLF